MRENLIQAIARRVPIDRTTARVVSVGPKGLDARKRITQAHSDVPLTTVAIPKSVRDLRGRTVGTLTVVGLAEPTKTQQKQQGNNRLWVCRCVCGHYLTRRGKAINNPSNQSDACDHCRYVQNLRRLSTFRELGHYPDEEPPAVDAAPLAEVEKR